MNVLKHDITINAGTIWRIVSEKRRLSVKEILEMTGYKEAMMLFALGWLVKEDKVELSDNEGTLYVNLTSSLSENYY
ncbi:winged helix-turn-helix domain-containing protein [Dysgonomonas sp. Marseille-P4677]|uniref:winged helix-turn-helix domain-containing protein n=1 Tax=Dysgonomonas sp. Marseille-P4677 TaxID=2364790 RepID=UPI0019126A9D|nr:winged helix-turn-helix domain-containing protein [Dysgonomonas sp. Marseille-P4677]MBK5721848.1 winged helix-turn-helix domain-containing protein [Dysgonomonas sp. Marseille-P4677]